MNNLFSNFTYMTFRLLQQIMKNIRVHFYTHSVWSYGYGNEIQQVCTGYTQRVIQLSSEDRQRYKGIQQQDRLQTIIQQVGLRFRKIKCKERQQRRIKEEDERIRSEEEAEERNKEKPSREDMKR